jgi:hypothetical protein
MTMRSPRADILSAVNANNVVRKSVIKGDFESGNVSEWKRPNAKLLVFISSTFTDTQIERNFLCESLLFDLRQKAREDGMLLFFSQEYFLTTVQKNIGIQVIFADMRTGIRDENTLDHKTWIECSNTIEWCKNESMGYCFLSLQGDKYGYTPLPKTIDQADLDAFLDQKDCSAEIRELIYSWYILDTNAYPKYQYVLRNMESTKDPAYWSAYENILPCLDGLEFDKERCGGLLIGNSVTEWECRLAFSPYPVDLTDTRERAFIWSHRELTGDLRVERDFCDHSERTACLISWMQETFHPSSIQNHKINIADLNDNTGQNDEKETVYD